VSRPARLPNGAKVRLRPEAAAFHKEGGEGEVAQGDRVGANWWYRVSFAGKEPVLVRGAHLVAA
jgi:hypothetical protein